MSIIGDSLRANLATRQAKADTQRRVQIKRGTLVNYRGFVAGVSLNSRGNRAYTLISGVGVVNAYIRNQTGTWQPGTGVSLEYDQELNRYYITGLDSEAFLAAGATVQTINPVSGDNLYIDSGFILDFLARPVITTGTSTLVEFKPGVLYYNGQRYEFDGSQEDLAEYVTSADTHAILQSWYDPDSNGIVFTQSTEQSTGTPFDSTDWQETLASASLAWLPLQAFKVLDNSNVNISQSNLLRDNRPIYTIPSGGRIGYPNPVTTNEVILDGYQLIVEAPFEIASGGTLTIGTGASLIIVPPEQHRSYAPKIVTSDYTIKASDRYIYADGSSNTVTVTLPDSNLYTGELFNVMAIDTSNQVDITTTSSQTINGGRIVLPAVLTLDDSATFQAVNGGWYIV